MSKAFEAAGWEVYTVDWDKKFNPTLCADIGTLTKQDIVDLCGGVPDVVWMSPDCTSYSIAAISHHRKKNAATGELEPQSEYAIFCDSVNKHIINVVVNELKPKFYFIENPRGGMRKMGFVQEIPRYTVTYCQYGDNRQKPTDIWTNHPSPAFKPACKPGSSCHESAPRGSKTGTQGRANKVERARIPQALCEHIVEICHTST
jgi:site-specific DNA-cytosine methylase